MRIAVIHSYYSSSAPSGENITVDRQVRALRDTGHEVLLVDRRTDQEARQLLYPVRAAVRVATGFGADPMELIRQYEPDVVHVHNLFPNFGDRWVRHLPAPLVATLHNYRTICANGLTYRNGTSCFKCGSGNSLHSVLHACYRGSTAATIPLAVANAGGLSHNRLLARADRLIFLSERSRDTLCQFGGETLLSKSRVIPNGIEDRVLPNPVGPPTHWMAVGRLSPEKGFLELLRRWPSAEELLIVGDGPLRTTLEEMAPPSVQFTGTVSQAEVDALLSRAWGLVFPSRCSEGFPTVVSEAMMQGTPVLAHSGNSGADFIDSTGAGAVYDESVDLASILGLVRDKHIQLGERARTAFLKNLTMEAWTRQLVAVYREAVSEGRVGHEGSWHRSLD